MKSLNDVFNQAAANRQYSLLLLWLVAWFILTDDADRRDADKRKKRDAQRRKGPSP